MAVTAVEIEDSFICVFLSVHSVSYRDLADQRWDRPDPFYEFDLQARVVKYKSEEDQEWHIYVPREAEVARGREYFKIH